MLNRNLARIIKFNGRNDKFLLCFFIISTLVFILPLYSEGQANANEISEKNILKPQTGEKLEINAFDNKLLLTFPAGAFSADNRITMTKLNEYLPLPWQLDLISPVYQLEINDKNSFQKLPYEIKIHYNQSNSYKKIFFYDKTSSSWRPLPTEDNQWRRMAATKINFPFVRLAVFAYPGILSQGKASWYAYKSGNFTASPDFPAGSKLRVLNKTNNKFVDVVVNDYGPNRSLHPDRVVDLEKTAFKKIASLSAGSADIFITPLYIPPERSKDLFGISDKGAKAEVAARSASAIIYKEGTGEILWSKNASSSRPLASLTKMVAIKTYLEIKSSLKDVITYKKQDEEYNYKYCEPWESAKLTVKEGDTLTATDLIYSALVGSANNAVESLVRASGLARDEFIAKMNANVISWGAQNTKFIEPTGLAPENVSSALDYAIITKATLSDPTIAKASTMLEYKFSTINTKIAHRIKNTNYLVQIQKYPINGSKTGYLEEAGYCLMTRIKNLKGENVIIVTLGAVDKNMSYDDMSNLIKYSLRKN